MSAASGPITISEAGGTPAKQAAAGRFRSELRGMWHRYWGRLLVTYGLFNFENLLRLAQPLLLGWAINGLLRSSHAGLIAFAAGHLAHLAIRTWRQMYDTRTFTRIHADRASQLVIEQRDEGVEVSRVAARSTLSREFVDFLERHVPMTIRALYSVLGALAMLLYFDGVLVLYCLAIMIPTAILNFAFGRRTLRLSRLLHDDLEREVTVVQQADRQQVREHFEQVSRTRIKLSDCEAWTVGAMECFVLALMAGALLRYCTTSGVAAGDIFAVFRYVLMFIMALDALPILVQQTSRLKDIGGRLQSTRGQA